MPKQVRTDPRTFKNLEAAVLSYHVAGRTESAALLIWFLENVFRLSDIEAVDAVCDASGDMGVDALYVNDEQQEIVLFQAKRKTKLPSTLGDTDLKKFVGTLPNFRTASSIRKMIATTKNADFKRLLIENDIANKVQSGFKPTLIFVANITADAAATAFVEASNTSGTAIDLWDLARLKPVLEQLAAEWCVNKEFKTRVRSDQSFVDGDRTAPKMILAALPASELVKIPGIDDYRVFAQNVRLSLGRTRVNREIDESVRTKAEHDRFLTFHNGLTIVAKELSLSGGWLRMNSYSVCNGCQSLLAFYRNRKALTPKLNILVRFVKVGEDRSLSEEIAYRTNNQNPISLRDLSANDATQVQLKNEFDKLFGEDSTYAIKRGVHAATPELPNELAGQLILALYAAKPWSAHQKYRVFGDLYGQIFAYGIGAPQIRLAQLVSSEIEGLLPSKISSERIRKYGLTRFLALYLVGQVLRQESDGRHLLEEPLPYLRVKRGAGTSEQAQVLTQIRQIAGDVLTELDYYLKNKGEAFDYKSEFKSELSVGPIRDEVIKAYLKDRDRGRATVFVLPKS